VIAAVGLFAALVASVVLLEVGTAGAAKAKVVGKTDKTPNAACPNNCAAIGSVTGFQTKADGKKQPFKIRKDGHIVAWSMDLGKPDKEQKKFFADLFGDDEFGDKASARLAVLKPKGKSKFKLKSQTPAVQTSTELGRNPVYTVNDPLRVKKGDVVGLTVPTWSANFQTQLSTGDNAWRASRSPKKCSDKIEDVRASKPHEQVGASRRFGCEFKGSRVLYWAYMVASGGNGGGGGGGNGGGGNGGGGGGNDNRSQTASPTGGVSLVG
jgi:hypothetical protein